ncbi:MAG: PAAR domain-containing protein [Burkholderiaceae bacterium]
MGMPAAKQGDQVVATDIHIQMIPSPGGPVPTPLPSPFAGQLDGALSSDVNIEGKPAATQGSTATNAPGHIPTAGPFQKPPSDKATIVKGSASVFINGKPAARSGDPAMTCNDPADVPGGSVVAVGTVSIGG